MRILTMVAVSTLFTSFLNAGIITDPGLADGSQFRVVFVTADRPAAGGLTTATSSDIGVYNSFVNTIGETLTWEGNVVSGWTAIASTPTIDAIVNTSTPVATSGIPIYRAIGGVRVAANYAGLWSFGGLEATISVAPDGGGFTHTAFTGSQFTGTGLGGNELGRINVMQGHPLLVDRRWVQLGAGGAAFPRALYGISPVLTVGGASSPVPEPSAFLLLVLCSTGGCLVYHRRGHLQIS